MFNETISSVTIFVSNSWNYLLTDFYTRTTEILSAPFQYENMLWMLLPLLATLILMEFYFGRHKDEELGWNTAYGNALVLLFVAIDLFRKLYEPSGETIQGFIFTTDNIKIIIPLGILILGFILVFVDFFHFLPKRIAYTISSPAYINLIGLLGIIIVYSNILLEWTTVFACVIIFILANLISIVLYYIIPAYKPPLHKILTAEDIEKYAEKKSKKKDKE
jgi:hypothetical protein